MPSTGYHLYLIGYNFPEKTSDQLHTDVHIKSWLQGDVDDRLQTQ